MDTSFWLAVLFAIGASALLNIGKGVQKWKVKVLGQRLGVLKAEYRRDFGVWMIGLGMTASASPLFSLSLKFADKPSTVSALNGVGLIGLVIFAWMVLGEKVGRREIAGAALIIGGTAIMGAFDEPTPSQAIDMTGVFGVAGGMAAFFIPAAIYSWRAKRFHGLVFGAMAGALIGMAMLLGDIALLKADNSIFGQLTGPTVYIALTVGTGALALTQVAFWRAPAMVVVPSINSFVIFTPAVLQYFAFGTALAPLQWVGIGVIVVGVILLTMSPQQEA